MTRPTGITPGLILLNLGLAAFLAVLWLAPGVPAQWRHWQAPAPQPPSLDDVEAAQLLANPAATAAYPAIAQRPLMEPTRRPLAAASGPAVAASAPPPPTAIEQAQLLGIVAGPALSGVLIEYEGSTSFVRRGERVGDWTLDSLQDREASFVRHGERHRLQLPFVHGAGAAPANTQPATPPARTARRAPPASPPPAAPARAAAPPPSPQAAASAPQRRTGSFGGSARPRPAEPPR